MSTSASLAVKAWSCMVNSMISRITHNSAAAQAPIQTLAIHKTAASIPQPILACHLLYLSQFSCCSWWGSALDQLAYLASAVPGGNLSCICLSLACAFLSWYCLVCFFFADVCLHSKFGLVAALVSFGQGCIFQLFSRPILRHSGPKWQEPHHSGSQRISSSLR